MVLIVFTNHMNNLLYNDTHKRFLEYDASSADNSTEMTGSELQEGCTFSEVNAQRKLGTSVSSNSLISYNSKNKHKFKCIGIIHANPVKRFVQFQ